MSRPDRTENRKSGGGAREWAPPLGEIVVVAAAAVALAAAVARLGGWIGRGEWLLIPCIWVFAAWAPLAARGASGSVIGFRTPSAGRDLGLVALASLVVFPAMALGERLLTRWGAALPLCPRPPRGEWGLWLVYQFGYVALSEETFFRGYVQSAVTRRASRRFGRSATWIGILSGAALFAVAHVAVLGRLTGLSVFPAGIIFGWLRARSGTLLAPILFHGLSNVAYILISVWLAGSG